jgi:hypothetical protein
VLYGGLQPPSSPGSSSSSSSNIHYWDRTASGLKVGRIRQLSVYFDTASECVAGLRVTYGSKPGVSHLMGTERGPAFVERLLLLDADEAVTHADVMYDTR